MFTLVLELIDKELNFTADVLIYRIVYSHKIWVVTALLLFTQLFTAVFTLVLELVDKDLNYTADMLIYRIVYPHKILSCNTAIVVYTVVYCSVYPCLGTNW